MARFKQDLKDKKRSAPLKQISVRFKKDGTPFKPHRYRPGTVALREIRKSQKSTEPLIAMAPLQRQIRTIAAECSSKDVRFNYVALEAIRVATEEHIINILTRAQRFAIHAKRKRVMDRDVDLAVSCAGTVDYE